MKTHFCNQTVSVFQPIESETVKQNHHLIKQPRNSNGTVSIKALAIAVLMRNSARNRSETKKLKSVSEPKRSETLCTKTSNDQSELYLTMFEERAAIIQFDGENNKEEAERLAFNEILHEFIRLEHPDIYNNYIQLITR